jgi:hypothetical protein
VKRRDTEDAEKKRKVENETPRAACAGGDGEHGGEDIADSSLRWE